MITALRGPGTVTTADPSTMPCSSAFAPFTPCGRPARVAWLVHGHTSVPPVFLCGECWYAARWRAELAGCDAAHSLDGVTWER